MMWPWIKQMDYWSEAWRGCEFTIGGERSCRAVSIRSAKTWETQEVRGGYWISFCPAAKNVIFKVCLFHRVDRKSDSSITTVGMAGGSTQKWKFSGEKGS